MEFVDQHTKNSASVCLNITYVYLNVVSFQQLYGLN